MSEILERREHLEPSECHDAAGPEPKRVGFDPADRLVIGSLPEPLSKTLSPTMADALNALNAEGARGAACRRLITRDIQLARAELRHAQALRNLALTRYMEGNAPVSKVALLERMVAGAHRRMLGAIELLARLDPAPAGVSITANQAAILLEAQR
jgi:hypothetical protein